MLFGFAGDINREALAALVFADPSARRSLNNATHLPILFEIIRQTAHYWIRFRPIVVIDMPLLFETGFFRVTRPNVVISCSVHVQLERLAARDSLSPEAALARIEAQMTLNRKDALADVVIQNNGSREELLDAVGGFVEHLRRRAWMHSLLLSPAGIALGFALIWNILH